MPPARRTRTSSSHGPAAKGAQKTLSFGNKVTKPATAVPYGKDISSPPTKAHPLSKTVNQEPEQEAKVQLEKEVKAELDTGHVDSSAAVSQQAKAELEAQVEGGDKSEDVIRAEKVSDAQIKKYWREREGERRTKRVHQEELGVEEKILRLFDMSSQFGVSTPFYYSHCLFRKEGWLGLCPSSCCFGFVLQKDFWLTFVCL